MESTGNTGYFVREIKDRVGGVKIINPTQFKIISQSVKKTDKRDVKIIAKYLSKGLVPKENQKRDALIGETCIVNKELIKLGEKLGLPLVATNDCHYLQKEDASAHDILLCIQTGKNINDPNRMRFGTDQFYFKSPQEMITTFSEIPQAIKNTLEIKERCNIKLELDTYHFPVFPLPEGETVNSYLKKSAEKGLKQKLSILG